MKHLIFLTLFLAIGLVGKESAEALNQVCYPGDNITDSKNFPKRTLAFRVVRWPFVTTPISNKLFGRPKMPELGTTHCHPFTDNLSNLLMEEYKLSWMTIVSDVQIIDGNPWWCADNGTPNHPKPFDNKLPPKLPHLYAILNIGLMELASLCVIYNIRIKKFLGMKKNSYGVVFHLNSGVEISKVTINTWILLSCFCALE